MIESKGNNQAGYLDTLKSITLYSHLLLVIKVTISYLKP